MLKNDIKLEIHYEKIVTEQPGYKDKIISTNDSKLKAIIIKADEERVMLKEALNIL